MSWWRKLFTNRCDGLGYRVGLIPLRLMIGVIFLYHGLQKVGIIGDGGFGGTAEMLRGMGFPGPAFWAVLLVLAEVAGGAMLVLGLLPRIGAAALAVVMAVALLTAHRGDPFAATHSQQMLLAGCITILIAGGGALSVQPSRPDSAATVARDAAAEESP